MNEAKLGPDFAKEKMAEFKKLINSSQSFTVVSMPGVGVSYFLKYLASQDFARSPSLRSDASGQVYFIHIDLYSLPTLSKHEFYRMFLTDLGGKPQSKTDEQVFLDTKTILKKLVEKHNKQSLRSNDLKIVIIFSRFDQLKKDLDENFLSNLQSLTTMTEGKIVLIFTAVKPLYELVPEAVTGGNLPFYSKIVYFTPFADSDIKKLFTLDHTMNYSAAKLTEYPTESSSVNHSSPQQAARYSGSRIKAHPNLNEMIEKSGGHYQLLNVIINSQKSNNLLLDKFVTLQLKDLYNYLDYSQKKQVQRIAFGKTVNDIDEYLMGVGYIQKTKEGLRLFCPVLEQYIKTNLPTKLSAKEAKLFKLLKSNLGKVVSKDEIFNEVWGENDEGATDWALDALIYRLRKHPFLKSQGYIIESHKKVGYTLIQT